MERAAASYLEIERHGDRRRTRYVQAHRWQVVRVLRPAALLDEPRPGAPRRLDDERSCELVDRTRGRAVGPRHRWPGVSRPLKNPYSGPDLGAGASAILLIDLSRRGINNAAHGSHLGIPTERRQPWRCGSVPEIVDHGETGFIVTTEDAAVAALTRLQLIDRRRVRSVFEQRFTATVMARNYLGLYWSCAAVSTTRPSSTVSMRTFTVSRVWAAGRP